MTDRVLAVMAYVFGVSVAPEDTIETVAEWDSLRHMELIIALEQEFDVLFETDELAEILSVTLIVEALARHGVTD